MTPELFRHLVGQARLAPSVHNVQPARWRLEGDTVWLLEDQTVRLHAGDPTGRDAGLSLGAAFEGMVMAAHTRGLRVRHTRVAPTTKDLRPVAQLRFQTGAEADPLSAHVATRQSWRGDFTTASDADRKTAAELISDDCTIFTPPETITFIAKLLDAASFTFMAQDDFRRELVGWMRLRQSHPRWGVDGLNADAMQLGLIEKLGAGFVMGAGFTPLAALGLAAPLVAETAKTTGAAAVVAFHRPATEDPFDSGRAFYRAWLRIEAAGFGAAVLAALADDYDSAMALSTLGEIDTNHRLVSAFRVGRRPDHKPVARARRALDDLIV